jgi:DNA-binding GntR family transcriptional regulator
VIRGAKTAASLAEQAYHALREQILDLRLLPGQLLAEHELAAQLGMSRTPVREAITRLRQEGLLTTVPRKGVIVTIPTVEAMREIYEIIIGIEGQAVRIAAARADAATIQQLEGVVAEQEAALAADDLGAWTRADRRFHDLLIEAAGNRRMRELMRQFDGQLHRMRVATIHLRPKPFLSTQDHRTVVEAIRARDDESAYRLHIAHRQRALAEILPLIQQYSGVVLRAMALTPQEAPTSAS